MSRGREKIRHENDRLAFIGQYGTHLGVGMAIDDKDIEDAVSEHNEQQDD